ncbi:fimbrial protein [Citrobacter sp. Ce119]|uniref:fimbrial protein n=1 Tax=Citrobacter sp. Ce119 TaxID=2985042 RepID=UPI00257541C7|nr:fimbrial protein [Citrobacter sp. Ce119]MDM3274098.1 fimbrial protein [Citrobacter sp. Ce119]
MKKAILAAAMVMAMGSTSAMAADQGGQLNFHGLVSATTCSKVVSTSRGDESTDGNIYLRTATPGDITTEVADTTYGALEEPFTIILNCKDASEVVGGTTVAKLSMVSSFGNTKGTLNNDTNLTAAGMAAAKNVNIAIHDADKKTLMKVDGADVHDATFDTSKVATYHFVASYVKAVLADDVTPGHVTTNAMYTFTYE